MHQTSKAVDWKRYVFYILITLAVGGISFLIGGPNGYEGLKKPPLSPPAWLFPVVWSILYVLMAWAAARISLTVDTDKKKALRLYWIQLGVNALWTFFFFRLEWRLFAFFWLLLLLALIVRLIARFRPIDLTASRLLWPYAAWVFFAGYLNLAFYLLNR